MKSKAARQTLTAATAPPESSTDDCQEPGVASSPLPDGWKWMNVARLSSKEPNSITDGPFGSKLKTAHYTQNGPRVIRLQNVGDAEFINAQAHIEASHFDTLQKHRVFPGDIVIAALGERLPRACVVPEGVGPAIVKADCIRFKPDAAHVARYLMYALNWEGTRKSLAGIVHGVGRPRLNLGEIKSIRLPVPSNGEQSAIVAEIEKQFTRLDAGVAALGRVQANLKRYHAAVLKAACEGHLVPTEAELARREGRSYETGADLLSGVLADRRARWNGRRSYKEPPHPDPTALPQLPDGWAWARLEQLGTVFGGLTKNPRRAKLPRRLPYLRVANVYANELRLDAIESIGVEDAELTKLLVEAGDLLIVEGNGSKGQIGRLAIWDGSIAPCVHQNHLIKVRLVKPLLPKWILYWLLSPAGRNFVEVVASSTSGLYTLSVNKVGDLPIAIPPLPEQKRVVEEIERQFSVADELKVGAAANLQRATRLRQSVLQRAFSGTLVSGRRDLSCQGAVLRRSDAEGLQ